MTEKNTQKEKVLKHLQNFGSITSWDAIELYGATRLSAIIYLLRQEGHKITSETENGRNRYGHPVQYAKYVYTRTAN